MSKNVIRIVPLALLALCGRNGSKAPVLIIVELPERAVQTNFAKGECKMPWTFSQICLVLFFLWYGLAEFIPALKSDMFQKIGAVLALLFAVLTLVRM